MFLMSSFVFLDKSGITYSMRSAIACDFGFQNSLITHVAQKWAAAVLPSRASFIWVRNIFLRFVRDIAAAAARCLLMLILLPCLAFAPGRSVPSGLRGVLSGSGGGTQG